MHHLRRRVGAVIATVAVGVLGCQKPAPAPSGEPGLKAALSALTGTYTWRSDLGRYLYSDTSGLEEILSMQDRDSAVSVLVECLDDASPSASTLDGTAVARGIVCYEALTQLVYHEPTGPDGDVAADWPGRLSPRASPDAMRAAKEAWQRVVAAKTYSFL